LALLLVYKLHPITTNMPSAKKNKSSASKKELRKAKIVGNQINLVRLFDTLSSPFGLSQTSAES